ncbi:MAG: DUF2029 domain-containing protein [Bacteroidia bacterium]|nr:DUF2029 domain-containing protein [Bacteroidia bacterium]
MTAEITHPVSTKKARNIILAVSAALILLISVFQYNKKRQDSFTPYNNYKIFSRSWENLRHQQPLYTYHYDQYFDLYKYSPTFPVLMAPFALLPDLAGLICWNLLNGLLLVYALLVIDWKSRVQQYLGLLVVFSELVTSLQNSQSNGLIAGLSLLAISGISQNRFYKPLLFILICAFIKVFSILLLLVFLLKRIRPPHILAGIALTALFVFLPLLFIPCGYLLQCYRDWFVLLRSDHDASVGISFLGFVSALFPGAELKTAVTLAGFVLLLGSWILYQFRIRIMSETDILQFGCSLLIWMVIFNHKGESPTYVIAVTGAVLLCFTIPPKITGMILLISMILLTCLSPTDLFPAGIRITWVVPYSLKALPCILIYFYYLLWLIQKTTRSTKSPVPV